MDTTARLDSLKKQVFYELLNLVGRVFVLVRYSEQVILGNRGFTAEEKENGIILVFNTSMHFNWDEYGITATLVFGTSPQKCFIPTDAIIAIYSSELNTQFIVSPPPQIIQEGMRAGKQENNTSLEGEPEKEGNIIRVDFTKKQKKHAAPEGEDS